MPVQGNLDPLVLLAGGIALDRAVDAVLEAFAGGPFIFNLGHGILPETPIAHVEQMLERVRGLDRLQRRRSLDPHGAATFKPSRPWLGAVIALAVTAVACWRCMLWRPSTLYLWLKALHVIAVIAWMAGMLYLPRLFVYHCEAEPGSSSPRPSR